MVTNNLFSVEYFQLQLRFAAKVAEVLGISFADAVGNYTNIYVRLGMGHRFSPDNRDWLRYVAELANVREPAELTHLVHRQRIHLSTGPTAAATVGCFSYALAGSDHVRLHFNAGDHLLESPISLANRAVRRVELAILLSQLKETAGENVHVVGASWLYNLDCYRRLFPEVYLASLQVVNHPYQRMPLWGQFLNRDRSVRSEGGSRFLATVAKACSIPELALCFPFPVLSTTAPARWFHDHVSQ